MAIVPTVKVVKETSDRGYMIIAEEDFDPDEHTLYDRDLKTEVGDVSYEIADNGWWTIYRDGEEIDSGRGEESLSDALSQYQ